MLQVVSAFLNVFLSAKGTRLADTTADDDLDSDEAESNADDDIDGEEEDDESDAEEEGGVKTMNTTSENEEVKRGQAVQNQISMYLTANQRHKWH